MATWASLFVSASIGCECPSLILLSDEESQGPRVPPPLPAVPPPSPSLFSAWFPPTAEKNVRTINHRVHRGAYPETAVSPARAVLIPPPISGYRGSKARGGSGACRIDSVLFREGGGSGSYEFKALTRMPRNVPRLLAEHAHSLSIDTWAAAAGCAPAASVLGP